VKWLTAAGAVAALAVGTATVIGVGWRGSLLLLAFFVSGSLLTKGGGQRTARQVIANGGVAAVAALLGSWPAFAGAVAAAAADTWATEIGAHSSRAPRLITTRAAVPPGAHGGVTVLGTAGGVLGAVVMATLAWVTGPRDLRLAGVVTVAGVAGMLIDSLLGSTLQGPDDKWLDNNGVNLAMTFAGAGIAAAGWRICC
jgi:uncharacterized protein (TIGR00297 family)